MDKRNDDKKSRLLKALEQGMTQIHLDARRPGVLVPKKFVGDHHLVLNVSFRFDPADLTVNEWGVRETLSFGGERFTIGVPWSALYAIASHVSHDFFMFPEDMPEELLQGAVERQSAVPPHARSDVAAMLAQVAAGMPKPEDASPPARAMLREVVLDDPTATGDEPPVEPTPPKRGHLRIVK
ncbi:MAG: ClpXP protease specificity-enhancing factor SspB [Myxococcales bacterium]|nr:ClpXP protease specificity-enhancing factor SspB [Myxococcales bacterium]